MKRRDLDIANCTLNVVSPVSLLEGYQPESLTRQVSRILTARKIVYGEIIYPTPVPPGWFLSNPTSKIWGPLHDNPVVRLHGAGPRELTCKDKTWQLAKIINTYHAKRERYKLDVRVFEKIKSQELLWNLDWTRFAAKWLGVNTYGLSAGLSAGLPPYVTDINALSNKQAWHLMRLIDEYTPSPNDNVVCRQTALDHLNGSYWWGVTEHMMRTIFDHHSKKGE